MFKRDYVRIEKKNNICIDVFFYEGGLVYLAYILDGKFEDCISLLLIADDNNSHDVYIMFISVRQKIVKQNFTDIACSVLVVRES